MKKKAAWTAVVAIIVLMVCMTAIRSVRTEFERPASAILHPVDGRETLLRELDGNTIVPDEKLLPGTGKDYAGYYRSEKAGSHQVPAVGYLISCHLSDSSSELFQISCLPENLEAEPEASPVDPVVYGGSSIFVMEYQIRFTAGGHRYTMDLPLDEENIYHEIAMNIARWIIDTDSKA